MYYLRIKAEKGTFQAGLLFFAFYASVVYSYNTYLFSLYDYMGARPKDVSILDVGLWLIVAFLAAYFCGTKLQRPGDFVLAIFYLTVVPCTLVLSNANQFLSELSVVSMFNSIPNAVMLGILILSVANLITSRAHESIRYYFNPTALYILIVANFFALLLLGYLSRDYFSMSFFGHHDRRMLSREFIPGGTLSAYFCSIFTHGVFPILLTYGVQKKKNIYVGIGLLNVLVLWGAFGEKYPMIIAAFIFFVMHYYRRMGYLHILHLVGVFLGVVLLGIIEAFVFDYSYINDYFLRRTLVVPEVMLGAAELYVDRFGHGFYTDTLIGVLFNSNRTTPLTLLIGSNIFANDQTNANVNFLALSWMQAGLMGVIIEAAIVAGVIILLNKIYQQRGDWLTISVAFLLATKIIEQSLLTALISSGIMLMLISVFFMTRAIKFENTLRH